MKAEHLQEAAKLQRKITELQKQAQKVADSKHYDAVSLQSYKRPEQTYQARYEDSPAIEPLYNALPLVRKVKELMIAHIEEVIKGYEQQLSGLGVEVEAYSLEQYLENKKAEEHLNSTFTDEMEQECHELWKKLKNPHDKLRWLSIDEKGLLVGHRVQPRQVGSRTKWTGNHVDYVFAKKCNIPDPKAMYWQWGELNPEVLVILRTLVG